MQTAGILIVLLVCYCRSTDGSNICSYEGDYFVCCSGWAKDRDGECTVPLCNGLCGREGKCIRPNVCFCPADGRAAPNCLESSNVRPNNDAPVDPLLALSSADTTPNCPSNCNDRGECNDGKCSCRDGFEGDACEREKTGECYMKIRRGLCVNSLGEGGFSTKEVCCSAFGAAWGSPCQVCSTTSCGKGFRRVDGDCQDIDECTLGVCRGGICRNTIGSFECDCPKGFAYDKNTASCVYKLDFCERNPGICGREGRCINKPDGSYVCQCAWSYVLARDGKSCIPRTPLAVNFCTIYKRQLCENGECVPRGRSYECTCNKGYALSSDRKSCNRKYDVCALYAGFLCQNGECISTGTDFMCRCKVGYFQSPDRKKCIGYCDNPPGVCRNGRCLPLPGSYRCDCNIGYTPSPDRRSCTRGKSNTDLLADSTGTGASMADAVDYCSYTAYRSKCAGGQCINLPASGTYRCRCLQGYLPASNGLACRKQGNGNIWVGGWQQSEKSTDPPSSWSSNFCALFGNALCVNGYCVDSGSSYKCRCNSGFTGSRDGKRCYDIDECSEQASICARGTCSNTIGAYTCHCYEGFTVKHVAGRPVCEDRDECSESFSLCRPNGRCVNLWGSYRCECNSGFKWDASYKQCLPESRAYPQRSCPECRFGCTWNSALNYVCDCPRNTSHLSNVGLCGDFQSVKSYGIAPPPSSKRQKRDIHSSAGGQQSGEPVIIFQLLPGVDVNQFLKSLVPETRQTHKQSCNVRYRTGGGYEVHCLLRRD